MSCPDCGAKMKPTGKKRILLATKTERGIPINLYEREYQCSKCGLWIHDEQRDVFTKGHLGM
jgi:hypothetical protein